MADADLNAPDRWTRRPLFSPSQLLTAEQLNLMMNEQRVLTEKLMRGLHGNGVIFGLAVTRDRGPTPLTVSCGMALDRHGRLLHWPGGPVTKTDLVAMPQCAGRFTLSIHHARREVPGGGCGPCSDRPQWIEEGVVFSLRDERRPIDRDCERPDDDACCIDLDEYICLRNGSREGPLSSAEDLKWACGEADKLARIDCSDISYDAEAGLPLAIVEVRNLCEDPKCTPQWGVGEVSETCESRPWVYRTPLLFELIKGCQDGLARVETVHWGPELDEAGKGWPDEATWDQFANAMRNGPEIAFTRPVRVESVHPGSVFLTAILWERAADYLLTMRIRASLQPIDPEDGLASRFRFRINPEWIQSEIDSRSQLKSGGRVELTVRGQMIRDRCDNLLDATPLDYDPSTPPHSRPGGDFVAILRFKADTRPSKPPPEPEPETEATDEDYQE